ncbi:hypothetical protein NUSPORA_00060 [Nucleospora cyclopteri]
MSHCNVYLISLHHSGLVRVSNLICFSYFPKPMHFEKDKMFCTICAVEVENESHYRSELHNLNAKRKLKGFPAFSEEEFETTSCSDDFSIDSILLESSSDEIEQKQPFLRSEKCHKSLFYKSKCVFCDQVESIEHYFLCHEFSLDQISYIYSKVCFVCKEGFSTKDCLMKHMKEEMHRNVLFDGISLYLENGKILNPDRMKLANLTKKIKPRNKT